MKTERLGSEGALLRRDKNLDSAGDGDSRVDSRDTEPDNPFLRFRELFEQAQSREQADATAAALATADAQGRPSVRMVLLKEVDATGFVFFTSYESRKARELQVNPLAALCFFWPSLLRQVRIEGSVERVTEAESDDYFATRPRGSQLAAWASRQSASLSSREELLSRYGEAAARFAGASVPRPPSWGGYRLIPDRFEFWEGFENRLHDRVLFSRIRGGWRVERLFP